ncbi:hypothetical protein E4U09_006983, partial [Claviceps aff. purpurea]
LHFYGAENRWSHFYGGGCYGAQKGYPDKVASSRALYPSRAPDPCLPHSGALPRHLRFHCHAAPPARSPRCRL